MSVMTYIQYICINVIIFIYYSIIYKTLNIYKIYLKYIQTFRKKVTNYCLV